MEKFILNIYNSGNFSTLFKTALSCVLSFDTQTTLRRSELEDCLTIYFDSPTDQSGNDH